METSLVLMKNDLRISSEGPHQALFFHVLYRETIQASKDFFVSCLDSLITNSWYKKRRSCLRETIIYTIAKDQAP